jgi:RHS repeat-associated protein
LNRIAGPGAPRAWGNASYAYDANGNVTGRGGDGFYFDLGNRMQLANGKASYLYDGLGRRVIANFAGGGRMLQYYSASGQLLFRQRQNGSSVQNIRHIHLGGKEIAESDTSYGTTFMHTDALGSPVAITNASGGLVSRTRYEAYGSTAAGTVPTGVGFTGHANDADTGLVYMQQRYYDPIASRFLSIDPVTTDANTGKGFNVYAYVNNNPYGARDPDGRQACDKNSGNCSNLPPGAAGPVGLLGMPSFPQFGPDASPPSAGANAPGGPYAEPSWREIGAVADGVATASMFTPIGPEVMAGRAIARGAFAAKEAQTASRVFSSEKQALVEMAKADKKAGMTAADMQAYKDLNKKLPDPFPSNKVRGPEAHNAGAPSSRQPHGHVGPVDHIPIRDPLP